MRIAQVLNSKAHWIFEAEGLPDYPADVKGEPILFVDVTEIPEVQEGWGYDRGSGEFTEPKEEVNKPSIHEQILFETQFQTLLLEMGGM